MAARAAMAARTLLPLALLALAVPLAHAGAVFEIRETVPATEKDLQFFFTQKLVDNDLGSVVGSRLKGAGQVFEPSVPPLTVFTLNEGTAVAPHIHPNGAETVYALKGKLQVVQFRGEQDGTTVRKVEIEEGEAAYIQQGAVHFVKNIADGTSQFLQIFDHPFAGAVFVANALVGLPRDVVNSAFSEDVLTSDKITATSPLISVRS